jgi:hypothetical protein
MSLLGDLLNGSPETVLHRLAAAAEDPTGLERRALGMLGFDRKDQNAIVVYTHEQNRQRERERERESLGKSEASQSSGASERSVVPPGVHQLPGEDENIPFEDLDYGDGPIPAELCDEVPEELQCWVDEVNRKFDAELVGSLANDPAYDMARATLGLPSRAELARRRP